MRKYIAAAAFRWLVLSSGLLVTGSLGMADEPVGLTIERVIGPEFGAQYKHPASITELTGGDLYLAYYGGDGEYAPDTAVYGTRRVKGASAWTQPKIIADTPFRSEGNPVVWEAPDGLVWLFYVVRYGDTWSSSRIAAKVSRDGAATWSDSLMITWEEGTMVRGRPELLSNGDWLLPVYHETGEDIDLTAADTSSFFLRYHPQNGTWSETPRIHARKGCLQPALAELEPGHLIAYLRRGGDFLPTTEGWVIRSESRDGGGTWTPGVDDKRFLNPNSAVDFLKLRSGSLLMIFNDSMNERTPLVAALSTDGDKSYAHRRMIAEGPFDYAYPYVIQARDGRIHLVYTSHERTVVNHAVFDEAWVKGKPG